MWVIIYPELRMEILRPMEKELAQSNMPFLSYSQKTAFFVISRKIIKNAVFFGYFFNMVSPIELIPSPWVLEFQYATLDV